MADLRSDSLLRYVLLLSLGLSAFWFWWRIPNFATGDEFRRVSQPMKVAQIVLTEQGFGAIDRAASEGVGRDATTYLHGVLLIPLFIYIVLSGRLDTFQSIDSSGSALAIWNTTPEWFWTATLLILRSANVVMVVGIVYITYRIGSILADRRAGQIASVFTALSLAVFQSAHEVNEDTPMLLLLLLVLYISLRYVENGNDREFLVGCVLGGAAIAFKLTGGVAVFFLGVAYVLRASDTSEPIRTLWRPRFLISGLLLGGVTIYIGIPNLLVGGPEWLFERLLFSHAEKASAAAPQGYRALLAYLNGLGLPLSVAAVIGVGASCKRVFDDWITQKSVVIILVGLFVYLLIFFGMWSQVRTHHILPSVPLLMLLLGASWSPYLRKDRRIVSVAFALLLVTTAAYAGAGVYQYTNDPRDESARWLESEAPPEATVTIYTWAPGEAGVDHGRSLDHYDFGRASSFPGESSTKRGEEYTDWVLATPKRQPEYIHVKRGIRGSDQYPRRGEFYDRLVYGDHYGYLPAAEFGKQTQDRTYTAEILRAGIVPEIEKRGGYIRLFAKNESFR